MKVTEESCRETSVQDFGGGTEGPFLGTSDLFGKTTMDKDNEVMWVRHDKTLGFVGWVNLVSR